MKKNAFFSPPPRLFGQGVRVLNSHLTCNKNSLTSFLILWVLVGSLLLGSKAQAQVNFPDLTKEDLKTTAKFLGPAISPSPLSSLIPLGGHLGVELTLMVTPIDLEKTPPIKEGLDKSSILFPRITLGKGLFHDVDVFFFITPNLTDYELGDFGTSVRWSFLELSDFGLNFSISPSLSSADFNNELFIKTQSLHIYANYHHVPFNVYLGFGNTKSSVTFRKEDKKEAATHEKFYPTLGLNFHVSSFFITLQASKPSGFQYSANLGFRF